MLALPYYKEEWKDIKDYEGLYQASNFIKIMNVKTGKILKPFKQKYGYYQVCLTKDGVHKVYSLHRLIAETFKPNPDNKPCIDHINTYKDDNRIENLKWVTHKENSSNPLTREHISKGKSGEKHPYYHKYGKDIPNAKPVLQYDLEGNFLREWECARQIERELGISFKYISRCCHNNYGRKTAGGYIWKFKE